ncbi:calcium-binding protein [Ancylobacter lacus]|uniref:calcium-binding protein n=1 Tax=Ancylobacter lacus TaxID=2579970 RepID=UPI001BCCB91D|nr:calcium-binding protein [Ancylobacter lacus]MBS7538697.1 hypothetical protein [Ancylobacter lacus]
MVQFTRSGKFSRNSTTTNTTTGEVLSTYGFYGSSGIYTAQGGDTTLTGSAYNEAFIYDLTLSGTNALRFSGFTAFDAGAGDDIMDFTVRAANAGHEYGTDADVSGGLGNDVIWSAGAHLNNIYGDEATMTGTSSSQVQGGDDRIDLSAASDSTKAYGDGYDLNCAKGGNDTIVGSAKSDYVCGDAFRLANDANASATGGNDIFDGSGGSENYYVVGDADRLALGSGATATGGDDQLTGGSGDDSLYGEGFYAGSSSGPHAGASYTVYCGNDTLVGGDGNDRLYGDTATVAANGTQYSGDDILIGGAGDDQLYGDFDALNGNAVGGNDTFIFDPGSGNDTIMGFGNGTDTRYGKDVIDISGYGYTDFDQLSISQDPYGGWQVDLGDGNSITVYGFMNGFTLSASDFKFAST